MDKLSSYYNTLDLQPGASQVEIKQSYKDLVFVWHPDRFANNPRLQDKAQRKLQEINAAYEFLKSYQLQQESQKQPERSEHQRSEHSASVKTTKIEVDYSRLEECLAAKRWKDADVETKEVILKAAKRKQEGWLQSQDINSFPSSVLKELDKRWRDASNNQFGFGIQREIWQALSSETDLSVYSQTKNECKFGIFTGWYIKGLWLLQWDDFSYDQLKKGSLPREYIFTLSGYRSYSNGWSGNLLWGFADLLKRLH